MMITKNMKIFCVLLFLICELKAYQVSEKDLITLRSKVFIKLDKCTKWREGLENSKILDYLLYNSKFDEFRIAATEIAADNYPESIDCLDSSSKEIRELQEVRLNQDSQGRTHDLELEHFLDPHQIREIHGVLEKTGRADLIEKALHQHFSLLSEKRRAQLVNEFFETSKIRSKRGLVEVAQSREPEPLKPELLSWQTSRQRGLVRNMEAKKSSKWAIMLLIGRQFYHLRKSSRVKYEPKLIEYCTSNIQTIIGNESFTELQSMFQDSDEIEHISTKYQQIIANLPDEEDRLTADHYGQFCRKIYRLVKFEQTDLFSWMNARQKIQLAEMIKDSGIEDEQVYEKLYEIFNQTKGEAREEADEIITLGCRQFIGNILGDEIAEEIEDMRWSRNVSSQYIAAVLMMKNQELENSADEQRKEKQEEEEDHTTRVRESLSICKRIYLDYNGSCSCNGFSDTCDSTTHTCQMCSENRAGHQCESCAKDFEMINSTCVRRSCQCNNHSEKCSGLICQECQHNTVGEQCELCADGFYGDATQGECKQCPCPKSGECSINSENILECSDCPVGFVGISCDIDSKTYSLNLSTTTIFQQTTTPMNNINNSIEDNDV